MTFDRSLRAALTVTGIAVPSGSIAFASDPRLRILEFKYNDRLPLAVLNAVDALELSCESLSKYGIALEHCYKGVGWFAELRRDTEDGE
jgi:hypothetical protein